jgi:O-acetyl-ADP-ribose deacetylase (regulator of RNase III)
MIQFTDGNLLESKAEALVNTVNTVGIMGKGIALQFKNLFPQNFKIYALACKENNLQVGQLIVTEESTLLTGKKTIINFPTKTDWRKPSEYSYIESGLKALVDTIEERKIKSIALPALGAGNGGLEWDKVKPIIEKYLSSVNCQVFVYRPNIAVAEVIPKERASLTPARAMLLAVLYDLVRNEEFVTEFACEKIAYFLQRFGATDVFRLNFQPHQNGPYSGQVKHVLYYLNGSYIAGYSSTNIKPLDEIELVMDSETLVLHYLEEKKKDGYETIVNTTKKFLNGFYSSFGLELLSTIDYISQQNNTTELKAITQKLETWNDTRNPLFANQRFVEVALKKLAGMTSN